MIDILKLRNELTYLLNELYSRSDSTYGYVVESLKSRGIKVLRDSTSGKHCITVPYILEAVKSND